MAKSVWQMIIRCLKITVGCAVFAAGFRFFTYPNAIVSGGVVGISMIINLLTGWPVGIVTLLINIPLFALSWRKLGLNFIVWSLAGTVLSSVLIDFFSLFPVSATNEPMLGAIYGGIIQGVGLGLVYSGGATTGGVDIAAKLLRIKFSHINFGTLILILDCGVIVTFAAVFGRYDSSMYAIISIFLVSKVLDLVLYGASNSKMCFIISDMSGEIKTAITETLRRGATMLHGEGAYSGAAKQVILCALKPQQIVELRRLVRDIDRNAFVIVSDAKEVFGDGFSGIDEYSF